MRTSLLLAVAAVFTASLFGCSDADTASTSLGRRSSSKTPPVAGTVGEHESDAEDENSVDPGNPNSSTNPDKPTTPGTASSEFAIAVTNNTPSLGLGEAMDLDVSITPKGAFNGAVELTVTGLPAGVTAAPVTANVSGTAATAAKIKLTSTTGATPSAKDTMSPIMIVAKNGAVTANAPANLKVAPKLTLTIPTNIDALKAANVQYRDEWGSAFGATQQPLKTQTGNGIVVTVYNADSKKHIIHGQNGFAHGSTNAGQEIQPNAFEMQNGAPRTRTLNPGTNASGYPHDFGNQGNGASFRISVQAN